MKIDFYWDKVSEMISGILLKHIKPNMSVLEVGFSGGHFLEWLNAAGYSKLHGIEIRREQFLETQKMFENKGLNHIQLLCGDILEHDKKYDAIFSTGLIQCLDFMKRDILIKHLSTLSGIVIFTVPEILEDRNMNSETATAVAGCKEYKTGNIAYELSKYFDSVRVGRIDKSVTNLEDNFIYYVCNKKIQ